MNHCFTGGYPTEQWTSGPTRPLKVAGEEGEEEEEEREKEEKEKDY